MFIKLTASSSISATETECYVKIDSIIKLERSVCNRVYVYLITGDTIIVTESIETILELINNATQSRSKLINE